ncbi:hypothetical protein MGG_17873 [Pyricularia oryzae 70-15]|uniref:Uncharacterized protein n=3 Tax=Pyricularia oryzae TaxID=318829 RepID=G5EHI8_PYRO7|nr:uncharacterized protein MGG_17873 [Pyricularia oryzae 70-15]ELQ41024.1 hypothetical protein OOU_Y34scaffold00308g35 [Pyricularia oryzae Y34]KAH8838641.1 hypothetical protein MCOR01_010070 [Pyricularia oryzae]EAQ71457.1 hypothetical protein MGCH7_ch7g864 [Pyricularia oryzae 70-15]EHA45870.1 hypothetical protein MGG_17873 [Pyricularia oryzae 70-15]KAI6342952.1 hypothetical protein MCOR28_005069 [Pyricularia oryzae]
MAVSFRESGDAEKHQPIQIRVRERVQTFEYATETKRKTTSCNNARGNNARAKRPPELSRTESELWANIARHILLIAFTRTVRDYVYTGLRGGAKGEGCRPPKRWQFRLISSPLALCCNYRRFETCINQPLLPTGFGKVLGYTGKVKFLHNPSNCRDG